MSVSEDQVALLALTRCALMLSDWIAEHTGVLPGFWPSDILLELEQQQLAVPYPYSVGAQSLLLRINELHRNAFTLFGATSIERDFTGAVSWLAHVHADHPLYGIYSARHWLKWVFDRAGTPAGTFDATYADALRDAEKVVARVEAARDAYDAERA